MRVGQQAPVELDDRSLVGRRQPEQRAGERRLAAARLADEAERLAAAQHERDVVDRADVVALLTEGLVHALRADDRLGVRVDHASEARGRGGAWQFVGLLPEVAAAVPAAPEVEERGLLATADVLGEAATIDEHARRQLGAELRQEAGDGVEPLAVLAHAAVRQAAQEPDRVRVARVVEHRLDRPLLDEPPGVEHADAVAHLRDDLEVVADEQDRRAELRAQRRDEVEHLRLDRRVEAGRRLVEDQQRRVLGQRHRDHDALLHPARELVRVAAHDPRRVGDLDLAQHLRRAVVRLARGHAGDRERLGDLVADPDRRVQRAARVLVDHRDARARASCARRPRSWRAGPRPRP